MVKKRKKVELGYKAVRVDRDTYDMARAIADATHRNLISVFRLALWAMVQAEGLHVGAVGQKEKAK